MPLLSIDKIHLETESLIDLTQMQQRILRLFAQRVYGTHVTVAAISSGLSGAQCLSVVVRDGDGALKSTAVAKLAPVSVIEHELDNYNRYISPLLPVTSFAHVITSVVSGAGGTGGFLMGAADYSETLYTLLKRDEEIACHTLALVRDATAVWLNSARRVCITVAKLRQSLIADEAFAPYSTLLDRDLVEQAESYQCEVVWCPQHGDLHGFNVLVQPSGKPIIIDYADARMAPAALDPVVLELSLLFHPHAAPLRALWSNLTEDARHWSDLSHYLRRCPFPRFIRMCRDWIADQARKDLVGSLATAYAFACRQLKYADVDRRLAVDVATSALRALVAIKNSQPVMTVVSPGGSATLETDRELTNTETAYPYWMVEQAS